MWLLSAGDCSPLTRRAAGIAGRICLLMSCTVRISRWIRASAPKMPRLRGMPWTCWPATLGGDERHTRPPRLLEGRNVDGGSPAVFRGVFGPAHVGRGVAARSRGVEVGAFVAGRAAPRGSAGVRAVVVRAALGVDEGLVGERDAPERCRVAAVVRVRSPGGLAVRHFDLLLRRGHRDAEDLVVGAAALGQAESFSLLPACMRAGVPRFSRC